MRLRICLIAAFCLLPLSVSAQDVQFGPTEIGGQFNSIFQYHPAFSAPYSGANSLRPTAEADNSYVATLMTYTRLSSHWHFRFDLEATGGRGFSGTVGVADFPNLDVVRNPALSKAPYPARIYMDYQSGGWKIRVGKFGLPDFFDQNSVLSDSHSQFMGWAVDNNGAWDYAADTRGYSMGLEIERQFGFVTVRVAEMMMPAVANGYTLACCNFINNRGENLEMEFHPGTKTVIRVLGYVNHARMGLYSAAGTDIVSTERDGRTKAGAGINMERRLTDRFSIAARLGWNDGRTESFAYTEMDNTALVGLGYKFSDSDKVGIAFESGGLSAQHRDYLARGGLGFLLGDGSLSYARENAVETYYTHRLFGHVLVGPDFQYITNPGYNSARGPVYVMGFRLHVEF